MSEPVIFVWVNEDALPEDIDGKVYDFLWPMSKVNMVRYFPWPLHAMGRLQYQPYALRKCNEETP